MVIKNSKEIRRFGIKITEEEAIAFVGIVHFYMLSGGGCEIRTRVTFWVNSLSKRADSATLPTLRIQAH